MSKRLSKLEERVSTVEADLKSIKKDVKGIKKSIKRLDKHLIKSKDATISWYEKILIAVGGAGAAYIIQHLLAK